MPDLDAIEMALRLTRQPGGPRKAAAGPLPANMLDLLKVAAEDSETVARCAHAKGVAPSALLESSRFALQKIILESGTDHHRALCLRPGASATELRDHKRLLLKWLHPDRNHNSWESGLFLRVQQAVEHLEAGEASVKPADVKPVAKPAGPRRKSHEKAKLNPGFRPRISRSQIVLRTVGIPALTIATAAAGLYLASLYAPSGAAAKASLFSLLQWPKP